MAKFAYNSTMHSSNQQTSLFVNHGLQPKFDIQGVNKVMNPIAKDWAMWLAYVWAQIVFNLKKTQRQYNESVNEHWKEQPNSKFRDHVWFRRQHINTIGPLEKLDH